MSRATIVIGILGVVGIVLAGASAYSWITTRPAESAATTTAFERQAEVPQVTGCDDVSYAAGGRGLDVCADPERVLYMAGLKIKASPLGPYSDRFVGTSQCSNLILASTVDQTLRLELRHFGIQAPGQSSPQAANSSLNSQLTNTTLEPGAMTTARVCTDTTRAGDYALVYSPLPPDGDRGIWTSRVG